MLVQAYSFDTFLKLDREPIRLLPLPDQLVPQIPSDPELPPQNVNSIDKTEINIKNAKKNSMDPKNCVEPHPSMYIYEDTILCPGEYQFPDLNGYFILFGNDNITLDCDGARLIGTYDAENDIGLSYAIHNNDYNNITIKNCVIDSFFVGIYNKDYYDQPLTNITIENNTFNLSSGWYIYFYNVHNSEISNNTKPEGSGGLGWPTIYMTSDSSGNTIRDNNFYGHAGIRLALNSNNNEVYGNTLGHIPPEAYERIGLSIDRGSEWNNVYNNDFIDIPDGYALGLFGHDNGETEYGAAYYNNIYENGFTDVHFGIVINHDVAENNIYNNTFDNITWNTVLLYPYQANSIWYYPHQNTFENNMITNGNRDFVLGKGVYENIFHNNTSSSTADSAVYMFQGTGAPIKSYGNTFEDNLFINSQNDGIYIENNTLNNNSFISNRIENAIGRGLTILSGNTSNTFYYNHFISNGIQAYDNGSGNTFDNGSSGNYWNDFKNPAEGCTDTDFNGICDDAYTNINGTAGSLDNYPISGVPLLETINPIVIDETGWAIITANATDPNGDELGYTVDNSNFGRFWCWPGTMSFAWHTNEYSGGNYTVNVTVDDGENEMQQTVNVTVQNTCNLNKWGQMVCQTHPYSPNCY